MKEFKIYRVNTLPQTGRNGDQYLLRKPNNRYEAYVVQPDGTLAFNKGITDEQNSRLERLSSDQISKVEAITTGDITKLKEDYTKEQIDTKISDLGNLASSSKVSLGNSTVLPVPPQSGGVTIPNAWAELAQNVTYTQAGGSPITGIDGHRSIAEWNNEDGEWVLVDMGELPNHSADEYDPEGALPQSQKGVADNTVNIGNGANKLLSLGITVPVRDAGYIRTSDNEWVESGVLQARVFEIKPGSISRIHLEGSYQFSTPRYYAEFSGDYKEASNFIKGLSNTGGGLQNIDTWVDVDPETRFIITEIYLTDNTGVSITEVETNSLYEDDGWKHLVIGTNKPIRVNNTYVNSEGNTGNNGNLWIDYYQVTKGSFSAVKIEGEANFSATLWFSQFRGLPLESENFIKGEKLPSTVPTPIDVWVDIDPEATILVVGGDRFRELKLVDVRSDSGSNIETSSTIDYSQSIDMGAVNIQGVEDDAINAGVAAGQSTEANNTPSKGVTLTPVEGNYMLGNRVIMVANSTPNTVSPLIASESLGESPIVSAMNHFSTVYRRLRNPNTVFLANSVAVGSRSIEVLSKHSTNTDWYEGGVNIYNSRYIPFLNGLKAYADSLGKKARLIFIKFGQGESNYSLQDTTMGITTGTSQTRNKEEYKALLLQYKNDAQADAMNILEQDKPPLFVIYQTGRQWVNQIEQEITMAQIEFAMENDDVVLMNPNYAVPGMRPTSDHYSENGARWYGELTGKALVQALIKGERPSLLQPMKVNIVDRATIQIQYRVPVQPIVIDNQMTRPQTGAGYYVEVDGNPIPVSETSVVGGDTINLKLASNMPNGLMKLSYAGSQTEGKGNVRDSDTYGSMYLYTDYTSIANAPEQHIARDQYGVPLYGKKYPLVNWANNLFYSEVLS